MDKTKSKDFIDYYNEIDIFLRKSGNFERKIPYYTIVNDSKLFVVQRFKQELLKFGDLRNAILHNPKIDDRTIAEPHEEIVRRIKELYEIITVPKKVSTTFNFKVLGAKENDFINEILAEMRVKSFSQFPVLNVSDEVIELINTNTISRWLCLKIENDGTILSDSVKVKDLIPEIEFNKNYKFVSQQTSIYEAYNHFLEAIKNNKRNLDCLFITNSGSSKEKLLGLITIEDIALEVEK